MSDEDRWSKEERSPLRRRWSRRKQRSHAEPGVDDQAGARSSVAEPMPDAVEDTGEIELPRIEDLDENSDYSAFLNPKVAEDLRRVALRKLFRSAVFNLRDGLDDYDEDFTVYEPLGDVVTADMRHEIRRKAERAKEELAATAGPDEATVAPEDADESSSAAEAKPVESNRLDEQATETTLASTEPEDDARLPNPCKPTS